MRKEKNMISNCHIHSDIDSDCLLCLKDHDEVDVITDHLPNPDEEAEYWEMKAEVHFGL